MAIDTLLAGGLRRIHEKRIAALCDDLASRLKQVEHATANLEDEGFADLMQATFEAVARTRSQEKRSRFANILAKQLATARPWDESETATKLLAGLEVIHLDVLVAATCAPAHEESFRGRSIVTLGEPPGWDKRQAIRPNLIEVFPHYSAPALRMTCAELVSKGVFHDEGVGIYDAVPMVFFSPTDLGYWFVQWVDDGAAATV